MQIINGNIYTQGAFKHGSITWTKDKITRVACNEGNTDARTHTANNAPISKDSQTPDTIDAQNAYVIPGLIDIHFHGCMGADFCDATHESLDTIARAQARFGTTSICPATMTYDNKTLTAIMNNTRTWTAKKDRSHLIGINMEGPYISEEKIGAQNPAYVRSASIDEFLQLQATSNNLIKIVDVAPEVEGNLNFIERLTRALPSVRISLAHTNATYAQSLAAFEKGARHITHLFNAMPPLTHRAPGPIAAAAENENVTAEIIADGVHIDAAMVRLAFKLFGAHRMILISDSLRACGLEDGTYDLGGQNVCVCGARATIENGSLAGSVSNLAQCLQWAVKGAGIPLENAIDAATINPARALGVDNTYGSLSEGKCADIVILDKDLQVQQVILAGTPLL